MTVKELINILSAFNDNAEIVSSSSDRLNPVCLFEILPMKKAKHQYNFIIREDGSVSMIKADSDLDTIASKS